MSDFPEVIIENEKGHKLDIIKANNRLLFRFYTIEF